MLEGFPTGSLVVLACLLASDMPILSIMLMFRFGLSMLLGWVIREPGMEASLKVAP